MTIPLLRPQDAARWLRISTSRLVQLDREGKLPVPRHSAGRRLYDPEIVELFAKDREEWRAETPPTEAA